ncbi:MULTISPECIES: hypothetical protein [unclassified Treponema]|uniref:hypothetical protein n=1 Tax=unclassified Treponema TaxID=2638727 RepID=UPI0020A27871|nr:MULTISPECIES: hypothetical protein [unclassified Treponema]UTC65858.1 hypothetical protein E4O06_07375 [Treponema sp. OMZ 789]UTC68586.1 hypothetical protein E4O01_07515 [Treponema sp. OMZ 790]UTC71316.1 hypothetical protein E4O02_07710 [Treponema sp. OMZ 791]
MNFKQYILAFFLVVFLMTEKGQTGFAAENESEYDIPYAKIFYEKDTDIYDAVYFLAVENGFSPLSYKRPQSGAELYKTFTLIDNSNLSNIGLKVFENTRKALITPKYLIQQEILKFNINAQLGIQGRFAHKVNEYSPRIDQFLAYNEMPVPLAVPIDFLISNYFYTYCYLSLNKNFAASKFSNTFLNIPLKGKDIDFHFPQKAGIAIGGSFFNLNIGRGSLNLGRTLGGSMLIADTADRFDYFTGSVFTKNLKLDVTIVELNPTRFLFMHEVTFRPIKQISITLHEGVLVNSFFDPRFLNPAMIFHSHAAWKEDYLPGTSPKSKNGAVGSQFGITIDAVPTKGLRIYGQFGMNQFQTPSELRGLNGKNYTPNSLGGLAGIEYIYPTKIGYIVSSIEGIYANPWYNILSNKKISYYHERQEISSSVLDYDKSQIYTWISNPYGPDTITAIAQISLINPKTYSTSFTYRLVCKGENEDNFFDKNKEKPSGVYYPEAEGNNHPEWLNWRTPSGTPAFFSTLKLSGSYNILHNLLIKGAFSWTNALGRIRGNAIDFSVSLEYSIR